MKIKRIPNIATVEDVEHFVKYIYNDLGVNFHPDDEFNDIINIETGEKSFNSADAEMYNKLVDDCFDVCDKNDVDFYEIALKYHPIIQKNKKYKYNA